MDNIERKHGMSFNEWLTLHIGLKSIKNYLHKSKYKL